MNLLEERIIEEIIKQLEFLDTIYKDEIKEIKTDLLNHNTTSLNTFIKKYYQDMEVSFEMKKFVTSLVEKELISSNYLEKINFKNNNNQNQEEKNALLRKKIIEARKIYLEDATKFIKELEEKDLEDIYHTLIDFYDISLMQHCISNLSFKTLKKLLTYVEDKLKENSHSAIDIFLEGAIKNNLPGKRKIA